MRREPGLTTAPSPVTSQLYRGHLGPSWRAATAEAVRRRVADRVVLVTGASSGIGRATALALGSAGAHVVGLARRAGELTRVQDSIERRGGTATMITCNIARPEQFDRALSELADLPVDTVISNAGLSLHRRIDEATDPLNDLARSTAVNLLGPVRLITGLLPGMIERGGGQLVNIGTVSAVVPTAGWASYAGSKAGFDAWWRSMAAEVRPYGIVTSTAHLPLVLTPMSAPTYRTRWGLTADQAASIVLAMLVRRPRLLVPWWARAAGTVSLLAPQLMEPRHRPVPRAAPR